VLITLPLRKQTVPAGATTNGICTYNCDTIAESIDLYYCPLERLLINDNDAAQL
jgi:hypothetical protein